MKTLLYPFVFLLSWYFWLAGHISYLIMTRFDDYDLWIDIWFPSYQSNMLLSSDLQDWIGGCGRLWPWERAEQ